MLDIRYETVNSAFDSSLRRKKENYKIQRMRFHMQDIQNSKYPVNMEKASSLKIKAGLNKQKQVFKGV